MSAATTQLKKKRSTTDLSAVPRGYKRTEVGVIPEDWEVRALGTLGQFKNGISKGKQDFGHGFPFVNLMDVFGVPKVSADPGFGLVNSSLGEREAYALQSGDVLFVRSSVKPEGVGLTTLIREALPNTVFSGFLIRYRDNGVFALEFKEHCFWKAGFRNRLIASSTVSANTNINQEALKSLQVAFPPNKSEQRAIAEALSDVDGLLGALEALIAKKRAIKQVAMQQLLTGKTRLPGFSGEWEVKLLGELIHLIPSGIYGLERQSGSLTGMPVVTTAHIDSNDAWNDKKMEIRYFTEAQIAQYSPSDGDLIVVKSSGSAASIQSGKIGFVTGNKIGACIFSNFLMLLRPIECQARYLFYQLVSGRVKRMLPHLVEASTYPNIRINDYLEIEIPLPHENEQTAIAAVLSDMDAELAALEARRDKTRAIKQGMMQQLLTGHVRLVEPAPAVASA